MLYFLFLQIRNKQINSEQFQIIHIAYIFYLIPNEHHKK